MIRKILLAMALGAAAPTGASAEDLPSGRRGLLLACTAEGPAANRFPDFGSKLCSDARARLAAAGWSVATVPASRLTSLTGLRAELSWLRLTVTLRSAHAVDGAAAWGGPVGSGSSPPMQAGIDDAGLNDGVAALLAGALLRESPFMTLRN
jgi:hypothetical protein